MSNVNHKELIKLISEMSVIELCSFIKELNDTFDLPAVQMAHAPISTVAAPAVEEKTEFNALLTKIGTNKIGAIKVLRQVTNQGLKEAKDSIESVTDSTPLMISSDITKEQGEVIKAQFAEIGATVELK